MNTPFQIPGAGVIAAATTPTPPALDSKELNSTETADAPLMKAAEPEPKLDSAPAAKQFTSHPVMRLGVGRFQFENGQLTLSDPGDIDEFERELAWLEQNQPTIRAMVKTLDLSIANHIAAQYRAAAHQGGSDTSMIRAGQAIGAAMTNSGEVA